MCLGARLRTDESSLRSPPPDSPRPGRHGALQTIFRPHSNKELFRLETLGLLGCSIMVYGAAAAAVIMCSLSRCLACMSKWVRVPTSVKRGCPPDVSAPHLPRRRRIILL